MAQSQRERIQELLTREPSPARAELLRLGFDALAGEPLEALLADPTLVSLITSALTRENAERVAERHLLAAVTRVQSELRTRSERVRDAMPEQAQGELLALVQGGKGPTFAWLKGAIDPGDLRQLLAPVLQQVLSQFVTKLPIPGAGGGTGPGLGGLVGMLSKQVSRGASQLADVGKSVIGGLSSELEKRMSSFTRDFSQTAVGEVKTALAERLKSDEGREILARIRAGVVTRVLDTKLSELVDDFLLVPADQVARIAEGVVDHQRSQPLFARLLELELQAALAAVGKRSLAELLEEAGILPAARSFSIAAVEPGLKRLAASPAFGEWLDQLLADTQEP